MKRLFFGITMFFGGLIGILSFLIVSIFRPTVYNGIDGMKGFLLGKGMTSTYSALKFMMVIGLIIMVYEAYLSDNFKIYLKEKFKSK